VKIRIGLLLMGLLLAAWPMAAHHSAAAEYESKISTIQGTVVQFQWRNPHVYIFVDVKDGGGAVMRMLCEANGPGGLTLNGWTKDSLHPGDNITIEGYRAKYRPNGFKVRSVIFANGRRLSMD